MTIASDPWPAGEWRRHLADAIRDPDELLELLDLLAGALGLLVKARVLDGHGGVDGRTAGG